MTAVKKTPSPIPVSFEQFKKNPIAAVAFCMLLAVSYLYVDLRSGYKEQIQRYQYAQQLPYQQLQGFLSSIYGTPMGQSAIPQAQTNRTAQNLGIAATIGGLIPEATRKQAIDYVAGLF